MVENNLKYVEILNNRFLNSLRFISENGFYFYRFSERERPLFLAVEVSNKVEELTGR